jgi:integrase
LLRELTQNYIDHRVKHKVCLGDNPDQYLGLEPDEALFISYQNKPFSITKKLTEKKNLTYACDALNRHIKMLLGNAGIKNPSILSGRRTYAVTLHRLGYDVAHIHKLLGNKTLETTQKLLTTDPVDMGKIAADAF